MEKRKIFLGTQEIAGMLERLNDGFHAMGIKSDFYCMQQYGFKAAEEEKDDLKILRKYHIHSKKRAQATKIPMKIWGNFLQTWDILHVFFHVMFRYDYFVFIFGHGMFYYSKLLRKAEWLEFFILKMFRKKMVMWLCGSDSRAPYCNGGAYYSDVKRLYQETKSRAKRIRMLEKYMMLIDYPASSHFHTKPYIIYNCIGVPVDDKERVYINSKHDGKVTILHAPSNQKGKGTEAIRTILKEIKEEGYDFEYVEVSGLPHDVVLEKIATSDIVIDQLYCDTPLAGFASEAAINAIPVIVGGYYAEVYKDVLPQPIAPTVFCLPEEIKEKIIYLLVHEKERKRIGCEEKAFVEKYCLSAIVCDKFLKIFRDSYPQEWMMDPADNDYLWGWGEDKEHVAADVARLIDRYGTSALCLNENSILYKKYIQLYKDYKRH